MLSCKEVCHLVSKSLDAPLPWRKRMGVRLHLSLCKACRQMARQMKLLQAAARHCVTDDRETPVNGRQELGKAARTRIGERLAKGRGIPPEKR